MNVAGLLVNIPGLVEVCVKLGACLVDSIKGYRDANKHAAEIADRFELLWKDVTDIIGTVKAIEHKLSEEMKTEIYKILERLRDILTNAINKASRSGIQVGITPTRRQALTFSVYHKSELESMLAKAQEWHSDMLKRLAVISFTHPGLLAELVTFLQPSPIPKSRTLANYPQIPVHEVVLETRPPMDLQPLRYSSVFRSKSQPNVLVEFRYYDKSSLMNDNMKETELNVYGMVRMLKSADSRLMSILKCSGVYLSFSESDPRFELQYSMPSDLNDPRSLRDLLTDRSNYKLHPLNHRFRLAKHLATSIVYMHSGQFVHKNIKPENILMMTSANGQIEEQFPYVLGWPFLVGFDRCRPASVLSGRYGEGKMEECLYQHPTRWGVVAEEAFTMLHDIYSLGVVLLEIGLWQSLVEWNEDTKGYVFAPFLTDIVVGSMNKDGITSRADHRSKMVKERLVQIAKIWLPPSMGDTYTAVVIACLEVLEGGMVKLNDFDKPNDEMVGTAYIKYVVSKLENLNV